MKIVKLKGGLGNQMFQYAFAKLLENKTKDTVKIDLSSYNGLNGDMVRKPRILKFDLSLPIASVQDIKQICKFKHTGNSQSNKYRVGIAMESILNKKYLLERNHVGCSVEQMINRDYFDGYWQNWEYIDSIYDELEHDYNFNGALESKTLELMDHIQSCASVFVGIRRGDYLTVKPEHYGIFDQNYYDRAMQCVADKIENPVFFIFSNDIDWVCKNMDFSKYDVVYVTETIDDFEDFLLMTKCKHAIIPNSTFHWWGARRYEYPGKVIIAPKKWFADDAPINILPNRWERI